MTERQNVEARLERERADLSAAIKALRERLMPADMLGAGPVGSLRGGMGERILREGAAALRDHPTLKAVQPVAEAAGSAVRANPVAAALAGAGLAWLAWGGIRSLKARPREARPQWLVEGAALREKAARLRAKIEAARAEGLLDAAECEESLAEVEASLQSEIRALMGRGLDGLEAETRAAALAAREAAWEKEFTGAGGGISRLLLPGSVLAVIGGLGAALMSRRSSPAPSAATEAESQAQDAIDAARRVIEAEVERLTEITAGLSQSLREMLDAAEDAAAQAKGGKENPPD